MGPGHPPWSTSPQPPHASLSPPTHTVEVYDPRRNAWAPGTPLEYPQAHGGAACMGGRLYLAFGHLGEVSQRIVSPMLRRVECACVRVCAFACVSELVSACLRACASACVHVRV